MSWTAPTVRATGDLITAAIYNTDLVNNLSYLHGDAGVTVLANGLQVAYGAGFSASNSTGGAVGILSAGGNTAASVTTVTGATELHLSAPSGKVKANGLAVLRQPYGIDQYLASDYTSWAAAPGGSVSVAFPLVYSGVPSVTVMVERAFAGDPGYGNAYNVTASGFTAYTQGVTAGSNWRVHWSAYGAG